MENNKQHWDRIGKGYDSNWKNFAKECLSKKEITFILKHFSLAKKNNILDIGSGNGRIIKSYLTCGNDNLNILGLDISESMVTVCQDKFKNYPNITIKKCDLSKENIPFDKKFNFISAIRVLKYNENWREIISKVSQRLEEDGIFVLTAMNNNSIDRFAMYPIKVYKTNRKEIEGVLRDNDLDIVEITSFTKIPDIFYNTMGKSQFLSYFLLAFEKILGGLFGKLFFGRIFFITVKKT